MGATVLLALNLLHSCPFLFYPEFLGLVRVLLVLHLLHSFHFHFYPEFLRLEHVLLVLRWLHSCPFLFLSRTPWARTGATGSTLAALWSLSSSSFSLFRKRKEFLWKKWRNCSTSMTKQEGLRLNNRDSYRQMHEQTIELNKWQRNDRMSKMNDKWTIDWAEWMMLNEQAKLHCWRAIKTSIKDDHLNHSNHPKQMN